MLSTIIEKFSSLNVLCIGDVMLDHFLYGKVNRISPEAPVPVFNFTHEKKMLGGAGNVVANLHSVGCSADIMCFIGDDIAGKAVVKFLDELCSDPLAIEVPGYPTIEKTRIIAGNNHLLRIDTEKKFSSVGHADKIFLGQLEQRVINADIVLLSDYAKGLLSEQRCKKIIACCKAHKKSVLVDPKGDNYQKYRGATLIKPNLKEFQQAAKIACSPRDANFAERLSSGAAKLFKKYGFENLLVTLSEYGMAFLSAANPHEIFKLPTEAKEVFDVSGAGDTSLAAFGAAMAAGATIQEAMKIANIASGIAVGKLGTSQVSAAELLAALQRYEKDMGDGWKNQRPKILPLEKAVAFAAEQRGRGRKIGFTNGCFDLLHQGHLYSLMQAKNECDVLIVGVNSDSSVKRLKGPDRPVQDEDTRAMLVASLTFVDCVVVFDADTAIPLVEAIRPDIILKEGYPIDQWPEGRLVEEYGGQAMTLKRLEGFSTTQTIARLRHC